MKKRKRFTDQEKKLLKYELTHFDKVFLALVGVFGFILFWKGLAIIFDQIDKIYGLNPAMLMITGTLIMLITGSLLKR